MERIEKTVDIFLKQIALHVLSNRSVIILFSFIFFIGFGLSKLPYSNLFFSPQIVLMMGLLLFFLLFPKKILYVFFVMFLLLFLFYTVTGGVINDILQNAFFVLLAVALIRPLFHHVAEKTEKQERDRA